MTSPGCCSRCWRPFTTDQGEVCPDCRTPAEALSVEFRRLGYALQVDDWEQVDWREVMDAACSITIVAAGLVATPSLEDGA